jgi:nucleotide-binding universal stress UspA family protein
MFDTVVLAIDGSDHSERAVVSVVTLIAEGVIGTVHLLHVVPPRPSEMVLASDAYVGVEHAYVTTLDHEIAIGREMLDRTARRLRKAGDSPIHTHLSTGDPARMIVDLAVDLDADLIAMGRRGIGGFGGMLLGSVTKKVQHVSTAAVLTVV